MGKWNSKSQLAALVTARKQKLSATQVNGAEKRGTATGTGSLPSTVSTTSSLSLLGAYTDSESD